MKISRISRIAFVPALTLSFYAGCTASSLPDGGTQDVGDDAPDTSGDISADLSGDIDGGTGENTYEPVPWPDTPVIDTGAPANAAELFGGAAGSPPCVLEPQDGSMLPRNWLRPRFNLNVAGGENLFEIKLTSDKAEGKTLTIYTTNPSYSMEGGYFSWIGNKGSNVPVTVNVSIRATTQTGGAVGTATTSFVIAPVSAGGSMVYWASKAAPDVPENSRLEGFRVGDEATVTALTPLDVVEADLRLENYASKPARGSAPAGKTSCIGCHTATPDGTAAVFNDGWPWAGVTASIEEGSKGQRAGGVSDLGAKLLQMPFIGTFTFSKSVWDGGKKYAVSTLTADGGGGYPYGGVRNAAISGDLIWIDVAAAGSGDLGATADAANTTIAGLKGTAWGTIPRTGDTRAPANPAWSNDGSIIAYASVAQVAGSHVGGVQGGMTPDTPVNGATESDIYTVPFTDGAGGAATPLPGASVAGAAEYYPDFSADGKFLAFNRDASTAGYIYYRPNAEINVIPVSGGEPHRLRANDPPACTGEVSPGVINSWAKWSPNSTTVDGVTYYWIVFSSARLYDEHFELTRDTYTPLESAKDVPFRTDASQLYLAAVAVAADGTITSYPATYIWNQTKDTSNLTPAWDEFKIPPVTTK